MPAAFKIFTAAHPITAHPSHPTQRSFRHVRASASAQQEPSLLTADQTAKALELQQKRAQQRAAAAPKQSTSAVQSPRRAANLDVHDCQGCSTACGISRPREPLHVRCMS